MQNFDYLSLFLFIIIGLFGAILLSYGKKNKIILVINSNQNLNFLKINIYYTLFFLLFVIFASFRKIGVGIGGADILNYVDAFENALVVTPRFEILFTFLLKLIRSFTSNYRIFFFLVYGIIVSSFIRFIERYCPDYVAFSPFICLIFLYLKDFNTLRSGIAVAVFLLALSVWNKKLISFILIFSTVLIHRSSILYALFYFFYYLYEKRLKNIKTSKLIFILSFYLIGMYLITSNAQGIILKLNLLEGNDVYYVRKSLNYNIFERWPMFFAQLCLLVCIIFFNKDLNKSIQINFIKVCCMYDFIMIPASLILGMWRANEYFYLARLIMWGEIIHIIEKKTKSKILIRVIFLLIFISWVIFRIFQEYDEIKVIPYIFEI